MTRDEAYQEYEEALAKIDQSISILNKARDKARATLRERLKALREQHHEELKAIRVLDQKAKRSKKC